MTTRKRHPKTLPNDHGIRRRRPVPASPFGLVRETRLAGSLADSVYHLLEHPELPTCADCQK